MVARTCSPAAVPGNHPAYKWSSMVTFMPSIQGFIACYNTWEGTEALRPAGTQRCLKPGGGPAATWRKLLRERGRPYGDVRRKRQRNFTRSWLPGQQSQQPAVDASPLAPPACPTSTASAAAPAAAAAPTAAAAGAAWASSCCFTAAKHSARCTRSCQAAWCASAAGLQGGRPSRPCWRRHFCSSRYLRHERHRFDALQSSALQTEVQHDLEQCNGWGTRVAAVSRVLCVLGGR